MIFNQLFPIFFILFLYDNTQGLNIQRVLRPRWSQTNRQICDTPILKNGKHSIRQRGKIILFKCNSGFTIVGNIYAGCNGGKWDAQIPVCTKSGCKKIESPQNGVIMSEDGRISTLYCQPNYQVAGPRYIFCNGSNWDGSIGSCRKTSVTVPTSCDFETDDLCQWTHDTDNHDFEWKRTIGRDVFRRLRTGPQTDHTTLKPNYGHYMLAESGSNHSPNDYARIISPIYLKIKESENVCFRFWYFMYGQTVGNLRVYLKLISLDMDMVTEDPKYLLYEQSGNQGNTWQEAFIQMEKFNENFQIVIEGTAGGGHFSDIAIDDVALLMNEACLGEFTTEMFITDDFAVFDIMTCKNRCDEQQSIVTEPSVIKKGRHHENITQACDCHDSCEESGTCCLDYRMLCIFGSTYEDEIYSETSTAKPIHTTTEAVADETDDWSSDVPEPKTRLPQKYSNRSTTMTTKIPNITTTLKHLTLNTEPLSTITIRRTTIESNEKLLPTTSSQPPVQNKSSSSSSLSLSSSSSSSSSPSSSSSSSSSSLSTTQTIQLSIYQGGVDNTKQQTFTDHIIRSGQSTSSPQPPTGGVLHKSTTNRNIFILTLIVLLAIGTILIVLNVVGLPKNIHKYLLQIRNSNGGSGNTGSQANDDCSNVSLCSNIRYLTSDEQLDFTMQTNQPPPQHQQQQFQETEITVNSSSKDNILLFPETLNEPTTINANSIENSTEHKTKSKFKSTNGLYKTNDKILNKLKRNRNEETNGLLSQDDCL